MTTDENAVAAGLDDAIRSRRAVGEGQSPTNPVPETTRATDEEALQPGTQAEAGKQNALLAGVERIEVAEALDPVVAGTERLVSRIFRPGVLRDLLHGVPLGHPAHPVAVLVPAGAWISSALLDLVSGQERASRMLVGVGLVCAIPAVSAGLVDWAALDREQKRVGIAHASANLAAVALYSASYSQRRRGRHTSGVILGLLGLGLVSASGYLGGHLAYRQGANVLSADDDTNIRAATYDAKAQVAERSL